MPIVTAVKLRFNPKHLWFNPQGKSYNIGDYVLVETERGREVGLVMDGAIEVTDAQIAKLKSKLKPVIRSLSDIDFDHLETLAAKGREALLPFRQLIAKHKLNVKPVEVEFLFSGDKAVFYFASEERVDFRDLVRDLAAHFRIRVDMRQIGARDEARILGGLAHCGEELCCKRIGGEFQPVSIRMAKEQDLPLNPAKISGACGRLMCCLRYEFEAYKDFKQRAPKRGSLIETPLGDAKVTDFNTPREIINMRLDDGKMLAIPLCEMDCQKDAKGCASHCKVSRETIDRCASSNVLLAMSALDRESELLDDALIFADAEDDGKDEDRPKARRRRRSPGSSADTHDQVTPKRATTKSVVASTPESDDIDINIQKRKPRRRRPTTQDKPTTKRAPLANIAKENKPKGSQTRKSQTDESFRQQKVRPRPGQHSSGLRNPEQHLSNSANNANDGKADNGTSGEPRDKSRRRRRRTN